MEFINLTLYDGKTKIEINPDHISEMMSLPSDDGRTIITMSSGEKYTVNETIEQIKGKIDIDPNAPMGPPT